MSLLFKYLFTNNRITPSFQDILIFTMCKIGSCYQSFKKYFYNAFLTTKYSRNAYTFTVYQINILYKKYQKLLLSMILNTFLSIFVIYIDRFLLLNFHKTEIHKQLSNDVSYEHVLLKAKVGK